MPLFCYRLALNSKGYIQKMKAKTTTLLIVVLLATALCTAAACSSANSPPEQSQEQITETPELPQEQTATTGEQSNNSAAQDIGQGTTVFLFEMTDGDGNKISWNVHTETETVGDALVEVGLIEGTESSFGLMVEYVNGVRADFAEDNAWWAFYIDGEMAMAGVDSTDIEEGVIYAFVFTSA